MENQVRKYKKYEKDLKFMLIASGVWPHYQKHPRAFRKFLSICSSFASGFTFYCIVAFCVKYSTNIKVFTSCLGLMIGFFTTFIKVCILSFYEADLLSMNEGVSAEFEENLKQPKRQSHLLAHFPTFFKFFYVYSFFVGASVLLLVIMPLLALRHGKYARMYPQALPFTYEPGGTAHWLIYGFEVLSGFYLWSVTCGVDALFGFYALHIVGELRLLGSRFQQLGSTTALYREQLKECLARHYLLMESRLRLQKIFGFLAIWLAVSCAIALCALVFQATQLKNSTVIRVMYLTGHVLLKLVQAYSYSWYGNIIAIESNRCLDSMYNAHWPGSGNTKFMNDVLIVLSQKPLTFKAKGWMDLRLDMFLKIVHTSVSYFFLLRTLDDKLTQ